MRPVILAFGALFVAMVTVAGSAAAQSSLRDCPLHIVQPGDTLRLISQRYLGGKKGSGLIYDLNRARIGPDPNQITPGLPLRIPCNLSSQAGAKPVEPPQAPRDAVAVMPEKQTAMLTGGPFHPFVDGTDVDGGLAVALLRAALGNQTAVKGDIAVVNDRPAHLQTLLPMGAFSVSFPWIYPDCTRDNLMAAEDALCQEFAASNSLYELVIEFYARADSPFAAATLADDLDGAILCRPEGYPPNDLYQMGLLPDRVTLVAGTDPADCLIKLDTGAADIASLDGLVTRSLVLGLDIRNPLVVLEQLTRVDGLRALARRDDAAGMAALDAINTGLETLSESGEWYRIVQRYLDDGQPVDTEEMAEAE